MTLNIDKCIDTLLNVQNMHSSIILPIVLNEIPIKHVLNYKFLGVYIDEKLDWKQQYRYVTSKLCRVFGILGNTTFSIRIRSGLHLDKFLIKITVSGS